MTDAAKRVLEDALALSDEERLGLVEALSDSFEGREVELATEWEAEVAGRIAQLERGEVQPVAWTDVESRIRHTLGRR